MVILRKLAFRVQSNLGAHPSKIKNAASLLETTFESFNFHSDMWVRNELHAQPRLRRTQASLRFFELASVLVRFNHVADRKRRTIWVADATSRRQKGVLATHQICVQNWCARPLYY